MPTKKVPNKTVESIAVRIFDWYEQQCHTDQQYAYGDIYETTWSEEMPYVVSDERYAREDGIEIGLQQGLQKGLLDGLRVSLKVKFGKRGEALLEQIRNRSLPAERISEILQVIEEDGSFDDLSKLVHQAE